MINRLRQRFRKGMTCAEVMEVLQTYLDGETDVEVARAVAKHLEDCPACDRESEVYRGIKVSLATRQRPVDPDVMASLRRFGEQLMTEGAD
ncbi:MAG: zf-HC2 domain-containing protein [Actinomycetota bacterium]